MPQDIPLEASDELAFIPPSLADIDTPPTFTLRAATLRDKRFNQRLFVRSGLEQHGTDAIRAEIRRGLKALWGDDKFAEHMPTLDAYWEAQDDFVALQKTDETLVFEYDTDLETACKMLTGRVAKAWPPLLEMLADNQDFNAMAIGLMVATIVRDWTGLDVTKAIEDGYRKDGYLTLDCADQVQEALDAMERAAGLPEGVAWGELGKACTDRLYLNRDSEKNSASPSPSPTLPASSSETTASGAFPESAISTETPGAT